MSIKHGMTKTGVYNSWAGMVQRCRNSKNKDYKHYGGRDIKVCKRWHDFLSFYADMGERPPGLTLDRIDNDGDYAPGNCRWATRKEQRNNSRQAFRAKLFIAQSPSGRVFLSNNQSDFARRYGLNPSSIRGCLVGRRGCKQHKKWTFKWFIGIPDDIEILKLGSHLTDQRV